MKKLLLVPIFLLAMHAPKAQTLNPALTTMLQDTLNFYVGSIPNIKGMSASVLLPGQGVWKGTAGISHTGVPIQQDMEFWIASNTKLFVSVMMLKLAERNIINLNDPLSTWLPAYPNVNSNITIRQLLNHTSGISDPIFIAPWMDTIMKYPTRVFTPTEVVGWLGAPYFPVGTSWGYSNVNYILAGMIAQNATGYHISRLIRDSLLTPLNLSNTYFDVEETIHGTIAHRWWNGIDYHDTSRIGINSVGGPAGAIFSTSGDMAEWYNIVFNGNILSAASKSELTNFVPTPSPTMYGLGVGRETTAGKTYWGHGGAIWGSRSKMIYDTCMGSVVCGLTNSYPSGMEAVSFLLYRVLLNHIPACPGIISGPGVVNQGQNSVTYTIPPIANATSFLWTLPGGATGTSNTNSITVNYGFSAISGTLKVQGSNIYGAGGIASLPIVVTGILPIELIKFDVGKQGRNSLITWTTASEQNSERFIIEHSIDGRSFTEIGMKEAAGSQQIEKNYSFLHTDPSAGRNYYRLKLVDRDGSYRYSNVRMLNFNNNETTVLIYPNPVSDELIIETEDPGKMVTITIFNQLGNTLYSGNSTGKVRIPVTTYPPGIYFIKLQGEKINTIKKFVKE